MLKKNLFFLLKVIGTAGFLFFILVSASLAGGDIYCKKNCSYASRGLPVRILQRLKIVNAYVRDSTLVLVLPVVKDKINAAQLDIESIMKQDPKFVLCDFTRSNVFSRFRAQLEDPFSAIRYIAFLATFLGLRHYLKENYGPVHLKERGGIVIRYQTFKTVRATDFILDKILDLPFLSGLYIAFDRKGARRLEFRKSLHELEIKRGMESRIAFMLLIEEDFKDFTILLGQTGYQKIHLSSIECK
jgi:hypothetical protein